MQQDEGNINSIMTELEESQLEAINVHKWIESEKLGKDIGLNIAMMDWFDKHFNVWKKNEWDAQIKKSKKISIKKQNGLQTH
jgi:hypothetical protein